MNQTAAAKFPPDRIHDLEATSYNVGDRTVTLEWTAVGDEADVGQGWSHIAMLRNNVTLFPFQRANTK